MILNFPSIFFFFENRFHLEELVGELWKGSLVQIIHLVHIPILHKCTLIQKAAPQKGPSYYCCCCHHLLLRIDLDHILEVLQELLDLLRHSIVEPVKDV